jgi:stage III sporulation protein AC
MDVGLVLKIAGIGMLVAVASQVLSRSGREDMATLVSVAGVVLALLLLVGEIASLFSLVQEVFGL